MSRLAACFLLLSVPSFAISEKNYDETYHSEVLPYYEKSVAGSFLGKDKVPIGFRIFESPQERATLVILPGRTAPMRQWAETIYDLRDLGLSIYILSHRGQGESGRLIANQQMQYVEKFDDYAEDLDVFIKTVVQPKQREKTMLLAHSMGGAIGALYILKHPKIFDSAVLSSPMFEINTSPIGNWLAHALSASACFLGFKESFAFGQRPYNRDAYLAEVLPNGGVPLSPARLTMAADIYERYPETKMGGVSYQFLLAGLRATRFITKNASSFQTPLLLFQAEKDAFVRPLGQDYFCSQAPNCQKVTFRESQHEILLGPDSTRDDALARIKAFLLPAEPSSS